MGTWLSLVFMYSEMQQISDPHGDLSQNCLKLSQNCCIYNPNWVLNLNLIWILWPENIPIFFWPINEIVNGTTILQETRQKLIQVDRSFQLFFSYTIVSSQAATGHLNLPGARWHFTSLCFPGQRDFGRFPGVLGGHTQCALCALVSTTVGKA